MGGCCRVQIFWRVNYGDFLTPVIPKGAFNPKNNEHFDCLKDHLDKPESTRALPGPTVTICPS